jgi:hypothetical protein
MLELEKMPILHKDVIAAADMRKVIKENLL